MTPIGAPLLFKQKRAKLSLTHHTTSVRASAHEICIIFARRPDTSPLCFWVNSDRRAPTPPHVFPKGVGGRFINSPPPLPLPHLDSVNSLSSQIGAVQAAARVSPLILRPVWTTCDPKSRPSAFQTRRQTGAGFFLLSKRGCRRVNPPVGALFRLCTTGSNSAPSIQGFNTECLSSPDTSQSAHTNGRWR